MGFIIISVIWGSTWFAIKVGLESIPPFYGLALRFTIAMAVFYAMMKLKHETLPKDRASKKLFATLGVLSFSIPFALVYWGEQYISSGLASILFAVYPFAVAGISHLVLPNEKLNPYKVGGITLGFFGLLIIFWSDIHIGTSSTTGMIAVVVSSMLQAFALVTVKKSGTHINPVAMNFGGLIVGVPIMYIMAFAFEDVSSVHFDMNGVSSILYLGVLGSVVTFSIYYWLLKKIEAVYLSLVSMVTPVLAVVLGTLWLHEEFSSRVFSGASLVLCGILFANGKELLGKFLPQQKELPARPEEEAA